MDCGEGASARQHVFLVPGKHARPGTAARPAEAGPPAPGGPALERAKQRLGRLPGGFSAAAGRASSGPRPPSAHPRVFTGQRRAEAQPEQAMRAPRPRGRDPSASRNTWFLILVTSASSCAFQNLSRKRRNRPSGFSPFWFFVDPSGGLEGAAQVGGEQCGFGASRPGGVCSWGVIRNPPLDSWLGG